MHGADSDTTHKCCMVCAGSYLIYSVFIVVVSSVSNKVIYCFFRPKKYNSKNNIISNTYFV